MVELICKFCEMTLVMMSISTVFHAIISGICDKSVSSALFVAKLYSRFLFPFVVVLVILK